MHEVRGIAALRLGLTLLATLLPLCLGIATALPEIVVLSSENVIKYTQRNIGE